jgi:hypothetical protein
MPQVPRQTSGLCRQNFIYYGGATTARVALTFLVFHKCYEFVTAFSAKREMPFFSVGQRKSWIGRVSTEPFIADVFGRCHHANRRIRVFKLPRCSSVTRLAFGEMCMGHRGTFSTRENWCSLLIRVDAKCLPNRFNHFLAALGTMSKMFALFHCERRAIQHETDKHRDWDMLRALIHVASL